MHVGELCRIYVASCSKQDAEALRGPFTCAVTTNERREMRLLATDKSNRPLNGDSISWLCRRSDLDAQPLVVKDVV